MNPETHLGLVVGYQPIDSLRPDPRNARTHSKRQILKLSTAVDRFGFLIPILVGPGDTIIAGHGRWQAAKLLGLTSLPVIRVMHLGPDEIRALMIADNKIAEEAGWDKELLAIELKELSFQTDFDVTITGFDMPEIDIIIGDASGKADKDDAIVVAENLPEITLPGDAWTLGPHIIACRDALEPESYSALMGDELAHVVFTDPPFNVRVDGNVSGKGRIHHREFVMASGEMSDGEFCGFLKQFTSLAASRSCDGALHYICIDWRHVDLLCAAGRESYSELLNLCVWVKANGGMGSLYRSRHELVLVFKKGTAPHRNNVQLGRFGRNRSNVWEYPSPSAFGRSGEEGYLAALHPTVKPVAMVADAILDCTARGDIVLDPFLGSGTTLMAAERVGRKCRGLELDPRYVDVIVRRWQRLTGDIAIHAESGRRFDDFAGEARNG